METFFTASAVAGPVFMQGLALGFSLIVAIGAQNAFVLRQGLRQEHIGPVVLFCAAMDAVLMTAGVYGMSQAIGDHPALARALALAGAVFLAWYGVKALRRMRSSESPAAAMQGAGPSGPSKRAALAQAAAFTLLNPHVYLDTVLLVGGLGAQQPVPLQPWFVTGACAASVVWFSLLGFGARWLAPWFARPRAWQVLDGLIGVTMGLLSFSMLRHALAASSLS